MQFSNSLMAMLVLAISATQAFPIGFGLEVRKLSNADCTAVAATTTKASAAKATTTAAAAAKATKAATGGSGALVSGTTYNAIQISTGTAGGAKAKADALLAAIDTSDLAAVSAADLKTIQSVHDTAEDAEVEAYNPAIAAASGAAATALQVCC